MIIVKILILISGLLASHITDNEIIFCNKYSIAKTLVMPRDSVLMNFPGLSIVWENDSSCNIEMSYQEFENYFKKIK